MATITKIPVSKEFMDALALAQASQGLLPHNPKAEDDVTLTLDQIMKAKPNHIKSLGYIAPLIYTRYICTKSKDQTEEREFIDKRSGYPIPKKFRIAEWRADLTSDAFEFTLDGNAQTANPVAKGFDPATGQPIY